MRRRTGRWGLGLNFEAFWPPGAALVAVAGRGADERVRVDPGRDPGIDIEPRGLQAFGGRPRRRGRARCEKLVSSDPGRGPGTVLELRDFLAFGGRPRRRGQARREKLLRLDPGNVTCRL